MLLAIMSFFSELKRRNVFKVAAAYVIVGWLLLQVSDTLVPALHLPEWFHSGVAFILIIGFPLAIIFAWAFEVTPEGIRREKDVDRSQSITSITGAKLNRTITIVLALALGYFIFDKFILQPKRDAQLVQTTQQVMEIAEQETAEESGPDEHSIAVLPLVDMSPANDSEYFSDGLTEELLNILAKISELRVAGRTSSFAFKGKNEDLRDIARKLNVKSILEGSVRKDNQRDRVRITLQLINASDGYHLWSETYDRELDDIFTVQEEVARKVASVLRVKLLGEDEIRLEQLVSTGASTYDLYLLAMQKIRNGSYIALDEAVVLLQQVLSQDPSYTPARLAMVHAWVEMASTGAISRQEAVSRGLPMLETVLDKTPESSDAYVNLAHLQFFQGDLDSAVKGFVKALELDPRNARALGEYGRYLFDMGQTTRGTELINEAVKIEPYSVRINWDQCQTSAYLGLRDTALEACARIAEVDPDSPLVNYGPALVNLFKGNIARGAKGYMDAIEQDPGDYEMIGAMAIFWSALGDAERAREWLQRADAIGAGQPVPTSARLQLYLFLEQHDLTRNLVRQAIAKNMEDRHGTNFFFRQINAFQSLANGEYELALAPYRDVVPWAFDKALELPDDPAANINDLIYVADLMLRADPLSERPRELLDIAAKYADRTIPSSGIWAGDYRNAQLATINGDDETAIELLNQCYEKGWRTYWRQFLVFDPVLSRLRDKAGYQELVARFETDVEKQRQLAYELMGIQK